jgi:preprotein translocase subunit SecB
MAKDITNSKDGAAATAGNSVTDGNAAATAKEAAAPRLSIVAQYIKDLSFENPAAPRAILERKKAPAININVNVNANPLSETDYDVLLTLNATAKEDEVVVFNVELVYGGVFRLAGFPKEHMLPLLFVECPRMLFPFARQIVADATRNGGFPPLMIDPIDFAQMFQQRMAAERAKNKEKPAEIQQPN